MKADLVVLCQVHPLALFQVPLLVMVRPRVWLGWEVNINSSGYKKTTFWCDSDANVALVVEMLLRPREGRGFFFGESCPFLEAGRNALTIQ